MLNFSDYSAELKYYDVSNELVVGKMKDGTGGAAIKEFVGLKPKMYSFLLNDSSEHKIETGVNKNVVATISHGEYKHLFLNKKVLRHSINRIQGKDHKIVNYEINEILLSCFGDKVYIENNEYVGLGLCY